MEGEKQKKSRTQKLIDYLEVFTIPEIWWQVYPIYHVSAKGNMFSLKSILYIQNGKGTKKYSRKNQLIHRSTQAKIFDALINIGYFDPLPVVREFPFIIQNHNRKKGMAGSYYLSDYYFPTALGGKGLAVELDSEYHSTTQDALRDSYLKETYGVEIFRIRHFERADVQRGRFKELCNLLRSQEPSTQPRVFNFMTTIQDYIRSKMGPGGLITPIPLINDTDLTDEEI